MAKAWLQKHEVVGSDASTGGKQRTDRKWLRMHMAINLKAYPQ